MNKTVLNFDDVSDHSMKNSIKMDPYSPDQADLVMIIKDLYNLKV
jgi:hypothetical protein